MSRASVERRKIRRALGPQAEGALLDVQATQLEMQQFLLLQHSFWKRVRWVLTGRF
jgi:hypothetical protein